MRHSWLCLVLVACSAGEPAPGPSDGDIDRPGDHDVPGDPDVQGDHDLGDHDTHGCATTIADVKTGAIAVGSEACLGSVDVSATATHGVFVMTRGASVNGGLYLSYPHGDDTQLGDTVTVGSAQVQSIGGELVLYAPALTVVDSGNAVEPVVVTASDLATDTSLSTSLEAMLVLVPTVTVVTATADSFTISDDGGEHLITIGGFLSQTVLNVSAGDMFDSITGIWRRTAAGYELEPRGEFDLAPAF